MIRWYTRVVDNFALLLWRETAGRDDGILSTVLTQTRAKFVDLYRFQSSERILLRLWVRYEHPCSTQKLFWWYAKIAAGYYEIQREVVQINGSALIKEMWILMWKVAWNASIHVLSTLLQALKEQFHAWRGIRWSQERGNLIPHTFPRLLTRITLVFPSVNEATVHISFPKTEILSAQYLRVTSVTKRRINEWITIHISAGEIRSRKSSCQIYEAFRAGLQCQVLYGRQSCRQTCAYFVQNRGKG